MLKRNKEVKAPARWETLSVAGYAAKERSVKSLKKTGNGTTTMGRPPKAKKERPYRMDPQDERRLQKLIEAAQWENPVCHVTVKPHEEQTPDFCRYMDIEDNASRDSLYATYTKMVLRERLLTLLKKLKAKKKGVA